MSVGEDWLYKEMNVTDVSSPYFARLQTAEAAFHKSQTKFIFKNVQRDVQKKGLRFSEPPGSYCTISEPPGSYFPSFSFTIWSLSQSHRCSEAKVLVSLRRHSAVWGNASFSGLKMWKPFQTELWNQSFEANFIFSLILMRSSDAINALSTFVWSADQTCRRRRINLEENLTKTELGGRWRRGIKFIWVSLFLLGYLLHWARLQTTSDSLQHNLAPPTSLWTAKTGNLNL